MPTKVVCASLPVSLKKILSSIVFSNINRKKDGFISLFLCHIPPCCHLPELKELQDASRIDLNLKTGEIKVWQMVYNPDLPDLVIQNGIQVS